ncbi:hypothetical protein I5589_06725 [Burkholderia vietnamiensis]|uniref:Uncharacterized protein n=1 Tax=Burkholderia vietnamiensis TaxID=60552 RepID=A0ABS1ARP3_BURVI|nr:hypothetical protein [Burkholderia vietnamiensis]MBJ9686772.1 hypothetical protein [Burkholderia vietnamiensis]
MIAPGIVTSPMRVLSEQEQKELLTLHEACKAAQTSEDPYPFDWLIGLLRGSKTVYTVDIRMDSSTITLYAPDDEPPPLPAGV